MAKASATIPVDISHLPELVAKMSGQLGLAIKVGSGVCAIAFAAIGGGAYVAYDLSSKQSEMNRSIGTLEGDDKRSVMGILGEIQRALKDLATAKGAPEAPPQKQGAIEGLPTMMGGWTGVRANSKDELAKALIKTPETKSPVWVYTNEPAAAVALENALKAQ